MNDLNIHAFKRDFEQKSLKKNSQGKGLIHDNPLLLSYDFEKYAEIFAARKAAYLEHENKERFLRAILSDPPFFVEQWSIGDMEEKTKSNKRALKELKKQTNEAQMVTEQTAKEAVSAYEEIENLNADSNELDEEIERLNAELSAIESEQKSVIAELESLENDNNEQDEELLLPTEQLHELEQFYNDQLEQIKETLDQVDKNLLPEKRNEEYSLQEDIGRLRVLSEDLESELQQLRKNNLDSNAQIRVEKSQFYEKLSRVLIQFQGIRDWTVVSPTKDQNQTNITFTYGGLSYDILLDMQGNVIKANAVDVKTGRPTCSEVMMNQLISSIKRHYPRDQQLGYLVMFLNARKGYR